MCCWIFECFVLPNKKNNHGVISDSQGEKVIAKRVEVLNETHEKVKNIILEHKGVFDKIVSALETKHLLSRDELLKMVA